MFNYVKCLAMEFCAFEYTPILLVADLAKSITKCFKKILNYFLELTVGLMLIKTSTKICFNMYVIKSKRKQKIEKT